MAKKGLSEGPKSETVKGPVPWDGKECVSCWKEKSNGLPSAESVGKSMNRNELDVSVKASWCWNEGGAGCREAAKTRPANVIGNIIT